MAEIAYAQSDRFILTTDNPRSEDPKAILEDMVRGLPTDYSANGQVIEDREEAIKTACKMARDGDVVLVAGKGHEEYQEIGSQRIPFSDRKILETYLVE
jgi:UDP-N-acetylmuramoyl-L-alanyl-D-glutamate--2,6-diaminopimelate ligase